MSPLILKPAPVTVAWEIVTLPVPVFFRITGKVLLPPRMMFPKLVITGLNFTSVTYAINGVTEEDGMPAVEGLGGNHIA